MPEQARLAEQVRPVEQIRVIEPPRLPLVEPTPVAPTRTHTVVTGETLVKIAQHYGMTVAELKQLNKLHANQVNAGTRLAVVAPEPSSKPVAAAQRSTLAELDSSKPASSRSDPASLAAPHTHTCLLYTSSQLVPFSG